MATHTYARKAPKNSFYASYSILRKRRYFKEQKSLFLKKSCLDEELIIDLAKFSSTYTTLSENEHGLLVDK